MKLVFAGTPDFAAEALSALTEAGHDIVLAMTQPDRPSGRGMQVTPSPVKALAVRHGIPVLQPHGLRIGGRHDGEARTAHERLMATPHDAMVVAAYGLILPPAVLTMPKLGCINIHASLLPRWRGAAPIQRAIEAGDRETGVTIMQMDAGLDTGPMLLVSTMPIEPDDTAASLTGRLAKLGSHAIVEALASLEAGGLEARSQHPPEDASRVTYAAKLAKSESPLDFALGSARIVDRIRAFDPWPGCTADLVASDARAPIAFKVWKAKRMASRAVVGDPGTVVDVSDGIVVATGDGAILLQELQKAGGKRQPATSFTRDFVDPAALRFVTTASPRPTPAVATVS